jgi:parallel beta-helix repeat protein
VRGNVLLVIALTCVMSLPCILMLMIVPTGTTAYSVHAPIEIDGDGGFTAANGVTSGTGIDSDPYVIEGYEIDAGEGVGILVSNTSAHFVVRSCYVHSGTTGIQFYSVSNGSVLSCVAEDNYESIVLISSDNSSVVGNTVSAMTWGIAVGLSADCLVKWNDVFSDEEASSIYVSASESVVVEQNNITALSSHGIWVSTSANCTILNNGLVEVDLLLDESVSCHLWNNSIVLSGIALVGSAAEHVNSHDIPSNNTANGLPIVYLASVENEAFDISGAGQVLVADCSDIEVTNGGISDIDNFLEPAWNAGCIVSILSSNVTVSNCTFTNCSIGVGIEKSTRVTVTGCHMVDSWYGVDAWNSEYVTVDNCTMTWSNPDWEVGVGFRECNYSGVSDSQILEAGLWGVTIFGSHDMSVLNTTITNATQSCISAGSYLIPTYNLTFRNCTLTGALWNAFELRDISDALIDGNTMIDFLRAIELQNSMNVTISNNTVMTCSWSGMSFYSASNCTVADNMIAGNREGISADFDSFDLTIVRNSIAMNDFGLDSSSLGLTVYHNDFYSNDWNVYSTRAGGIWSLTYPGGGNYWDGYAGQDVFSGPAQDIPGSDGLGDTPFAIPVYLGDFDSYPLMEPFLGPLDTGPTAKATVSPGQGDTVTEFIFDAGNSSDPDDATSLLEVRWDFDSNGIWDTNWTTDKVVSHFFESSGIHYVTVQVRDTDGFTDTATIQVQVVDVIPEFGDFSLVIVLIIIVFVTMLGRMRGPGKASG